MALFAGMLRAIVKRVPQVPDADAIRYLRQQQSGASWAAQHLRLHPAADVP